MKPVEIKPGFQIIDLALYLTEHNTLVIGDTHIGYEEALNKVGVMIPRQQHDSLINRMDKAIRQAKPERIVINGDVKHEFGTISNQEWRETVKVVDFILDSCEEAILVKGNHDTILGPIAKKKKLQIYDSYSVGDIYITHGHKIPKGLNRSKHRTIVIGHEHPAISIRHGPRAETYKCFLAGKWKRKDLIVMPSFHLLTEGTDVSKETLLSPFLEEGVQNFKVYAVADKVYPFGRVRDIQASSAL